MNLTRTLSRLRQFDLQAKINLVLIGVILPTFVIVTIAQNQLARPLLEEELKRAGISAAGKFALEIAARRLLADPDPTTAIERRMREFLYFHPSVSRMDVLVRDPESGNTKVIATNIEDDDLDVAIAFPKIPQSIGTRHRTEESGEVNWEIIVPIEQRPWGEKSQGKVLGAVHATVSLKIVKRIAATLWKSTVIAALFTVLVLIFALRYFLRKTIANDRKLRRAESQNMVLTEQLHEAQRQVMNTEKLAVMGQLTASFAHEIGTPLNAMGGHLQLLRDDLTGSPAPCLERVDIIDGQLKRIEKVVTGFLQSTAKPPSQKQLVDLNQLAEKTLVLVRPRLEHLDVDVRRNLDRAMGPLRAVPLEIEQVLINVVNNSLDGLSTKLNENGSRHRAQIELTTRSEHHSGRNWATLTVYDTGVGIRKSDLSKVAKPFFTTKPPGEGTGLGLTISQQLLRKHGGSLEIESREGSWTRVTLRIPYQAGVNT